jgi:hypothetical protein
MATGVIKGNKPQRPRKRPAKKAALERQVKAAWEAYVLARKAFRAQAINQTQSDIARDVWIETSKQLDRLEAKKEKVVA